MLSDCPEADIAMTSRGRGNDAGNARIAWGASRSANDVWRLALRVLFLLCSLQDTLANRSHGFC
jgi:hypothetical protein